MTDTTIFLGTFPIYEPMTAFTDLVITALGFLFFFRLRKLAVSTSTQNWSLFFLMLGISTLLGACSHAFFLIHDGWQYKTVWLSMQILNGYAIYRAQLATFGSVLKKSPYKTAWRWSYLIQLVLFVACVLIIQKYIVTIIENAIGLIPIMILHYMAKEKVRGSRMIANGIAISFITAIVHGAKFSLHAYFNYNDIAHIFIMISLWVMYRGAKENAISAE